MTQPVAAPLPTMPSDRHVLPLIIPPFLAPKRQGETEQSRQENNECFVGAAGNRSSLLSDRQREAGREREQGLGCQRCEVGARKEPL